MAFKRMPTTPEERAARDAEMLDFRRRRQDHESFQGETPAPYKVQIVDHPVVEPHGLLTHFKARDEQGIVTLLLKGDRSAEGLFEDRVVALNRALNAQPRDVDLVREGVASDVVGVPAMVGWDGKRDPKGPFRAIFVETMAYTLDGVTHTYGRPVMPALEAPTPTKAANVVDLSSAPVAPARQNEGSGGEVVAMVSNESVEDRVVFGGRKLRPMTFDLEGAGVRDANGALVFQEASNARGKVTVVVPQGRADAFAQSPASAALDAAVARGETVALHAQGVFQSSGAASGGASAQHWSFKVAQAAFEVDGQAYTLGRSVVADVRSADAVHSGAKRRERDESR